MDSFLLGMIKDKLEINDLRPNDKLSNVVHGKKSISGLESYLNRYLSVKISVDDFRKNDRIVDIIDSIKKQIIGNSKELNSKKIKPSRVRKYYPLTGAQKRLWVMYKLSPTSPFYNQGEIMALHGNLNIPILDLSVQALMDRHQILHYNITEKKNRPVQYLARKKIKLKIYNIEKLDNDHKKSRADQIIKRLLNKPFNLESDPLLRAALIKTGKYDYILAIVMHHIISDIPSFNIFRREMIELYGAAVDKRPQKLPELPVNFHDYAIWENSRGSDNRNPIQEKYWLDKFSGELPVLELPGDRPRPPEPTYRGRTESIVLDEQTTRQLNKLCRETSTTLFNLVFTIVNIFLFRISGQNDLIVGTPLTERRLPELKNLIGFFVSTLAIRTNITGEMTFRQQLELTKKNLLSDMMNKEYPLEKIIDKLELGRDISRNPVFNIFFQLEHQQAGDKAVDNNINWGNYRSIQDYQETAQFDIKIFTFATDKNLLIKFNYTNDLFDASTVRNFLHIFKRLTVDILNDPNKKIHDYELVSGKEKEQLIHGFNDTGRKYLKNSTIHKMFEDQVKRAPHKIAIRFENRTITYAELNQQANRLAFYLRKKHSIRPEDIIGIMLDRSPEMIIAILAVLKAGGAYLPIYPALPPARISAMLRKSKANLVITSRDYKKHIDIRKVRIIDISRNEVLNGEQNKSNINSMCLPSNAAYVYFTSGSTGEAKGIISEHRNTVNYIYSFKKKFRNLGNLSILNSTSVSFDPFVMETIVSLTCGMKVVIVGEYETGDIETLGKRIIEEKVDFLQMTPSHLKLFISHKICETVFRQVKYIMAGGETVSKDLIVALRRLTKAKIYNVYSPTEATLWSTIGQIADPNKITVGKPFANNVYVLDSHRKFVPPGIPGELYISGDSLARGYLNDPVKTKQVFIPHPFRKGEMIYRTGDRAKMHEDGNIEILGRLDHQVKIRGFRVEPGEIEAALRGLDGIKDALVIAGGQGKDIVYLAAYYIAKDNKIVSPRLLKDRLKNILPAYMIPDYFIRLDGFSLNSNGKIDREALPQPNECHLPKSGYEPPKTKTEKSLAALWREVLNVKKISRANNFFDLGGHSLKAIRLLTRLNREFRVDLPLKEVFLHPTLSEQAAVIDSRKTVTLAEIKPAPRRQYYPLSHAQKRMWVLYKLEPESAFYNISQFREFTGVLDVNVLDQSLRLMIFRHASLRTNMLEKNGGPVQYVRPAGETDKGRVMEVIDIGNKAADGGRRVKHENLLNNTIEKYTNTSFKLESKPLYRFALILTGKNKYLFITVFHHVITDGWSMAIFWRELAQAYNAITQRKKPDLAPLPIDYKDYAVWEQSPAAGKKFATQERYWLKTLKGPLPVLDLPSDRPRQPSQTYRGKIEVFTLDRPTVLSLRKTARTVGATMYALLLGIYFIMLHRLSGQTDIIVGTPSYNRKFPELDGLIGTFINHLCLRMNVDPSNFFDAFIRETRQTILTATENEGFSFEHLIEKLSPERNLSQSPIFNVLFQFNEKPEGKADMAGLKIAANHTVQNTTLYDFNLRAFATSRDTIAFSCLYSADIFESATIRRFLKIYTLIAAAVARDPRQKIADIDILGRTDKQLLVRTNRTATPYPRSKTLPQLFEKTARLYPRRIAINHELGGLSYQQLNKQANRLAHFLRDRYRIKPDTPVALLLGRSPRMIVAILAVLKAGGCYVPIDPGFPRQRIAYMLKDSGSRVVLTDQAEFKGIRGVKIKVVDVGADFSGYSAANPKNINKPTDLAAIIFTSGSTGRPKGVALHHRGIINHAYTQIKLFNIDHRSRICQNLHYYIVAANWQLFAPWLTGASLLLYPADTIEDTVRLFRHADRDRADFVSATPTMLEAILAPVSAGKLGRLAGIKYILLIGEKTPPTMPARLYGQFRPALANLYGQSECSDDTLHYFIPRQKTYTVVPAGTPSNNTQAYILDSQMNLLPPGIPGELYISGDGLARGYLNDPSKTAAVFLPHPFIKGKRIYKTGDRARLNPDGQFETLGRIDHQIKIRGFRIEPGEVESILKGIAGIAKAVVARHPEEESLVAYFTLRPKTAVNVREIKTRLKTLLPAYMIPSHFIRLEEFPQTASGKLDRTALPAPGAAHLLKAGYEAPRTATEKTLAALWREVLKVKKISRQDDFFDLGGHSLKAIGMLSRVNHLFKVNLLFREIFLQPVLKDLAAIIEGFNRDTAGKETVIPHARPQKTYPLTRMQRIFYIESRLSPPSKFINSFIVEIKDKMTATVLGKVMRELAARHEALRANFIEKKNVIRQVIRASIEVKIKRTDPKGKISVENRYLLPGMILRQEQKVPFDLEKHPLVRVNWIAAGDNDNIIVLTFHHLIYDKETMAIIRKEFSALCHYYAAGQKQGHRYPLEPLQANYTDYLVWENGRDLSGQEKFWLDKFGAGLPRIDFGSRSVKKIIENIEPSGSNMAELRADSSRRIDRICGDLGITHFPFFWGVFNVFLHRISGYTDLAARTIVSVRKSEQLKGMAGLFISSIAFKSSIDSRLAFADYLRELKNDYAEAIDNCEVPLIDLIHKYGLSQYYGNRSTNIFYQLEYSDNYEFGDSTARQRRINVTSRMVNDSHDDLRQHIRIDNESINIMMTYNQNIFSARTAEKLTEHYIYLQKAIAGNMQKKIKNIF